MSHRQKEIGRWQNKRPTATAQTFLLQRMGVPEDVTGLVLFLASDHPSWNPGTNFTVDGGVTQNPY